MKSPEWVEKHQPFPIDGLATGLEQYANEMFVLGELRGEIDYRKVFRQELMREAFDELAARPELRQELQQAREVAQRIGY